MHPEVSVIMASYNHEAYIGETIESILNQTLRDFELIIVDDGSTDLSQKIIQEYARKDKRILFVEQENQGPSSAFNSAISLAGGKYIALHSSDDKSAPDRLDKQVASLEDHTDCDMVGSHIIEIDSDSKAATISQLYEPWFNCEYNFNEPETWIWQNRVCAPTVMVRRVFFERYGLFDPDLLYTQDWEMWIRALSMGCRIKILPEKLLYYRNHGENLTHKNPERRFWEFAYISAKTLQPYLLKIGRVDLAIKDFKTFLFNDYYPSDTIKQQNLLSLLSSQSLKLTFNEIWKRLDVSAQLLSHNLVINELRDDIVAQERYIAEFRRELEDKNGKLAERDQQLAERDQQLAERDQQLAEQNQRLADRDQQLAEQNQHLADRDQQLAEQNQHLAYHKKQIEDLLNSYSWRITAPLRLPGYLIRRRVPPAQLKSEKDIVFKPYQVQPLYPPGKNRPRIVHALANFMTGGSSRLVVDLIEHLGHLYEQEVITSYNPAPPSYLGVNIHDFPQLTSPDKAIKFLEKYQPNLLHVHYWGECDKGWYEQVFWAGKEYGCKVIENINTPVEPYFAEYIERYIYVSEYVHKTFGRQDEKSSVIYPGSNFDIFKRVNKQDVPNNCIGMVYRLEPDKLYEQSIDVFIKVAKRRPETKIVIVGGGTFIEPYKDAVKNAGVQDSFVFTGYVPYENLPVLYEQMSIFVAPVWKESFGQVSSFAMNMGIPVVGYNIGALPEIIADDELLAPPGDSDRLADIIIDLLNNHEKLKSIGASNRKRVQSLFSVEAMINSYADLYKSLIKVKK